MKLPDKATVLKNFSLCENWEEKYFYLIEIGRNVPIFPIHERKKEHIVLGCQSQTWVRLRLDDRRHAVLCGDSDSVIVKGLMAVIFVFYQQRALSYIARQDVRCFLNRISITQHLTAFRLHGMESIVRCIRAQTHVLLSRVQ